MMPGNFMEVYTRPQLREKYAKIAEEAIFASDFENKVCQYYVEIKTDITEDVFEHFKTYSYKGTVLCISWDGKDQNSQILYGFEFLEDLYIFTMRFHNA